MAEFINPATVPKVTLPSGEEVPCMGMGTFGSDRVSPEDVSAAVGGAIRSGYRMFDCMEMKTRSERFSKKPLKKVLLREKNFSS